MRMTQVLITGDVSVDHNVYIGEKSFPKAHDARGTILDSRIGGFYLLHDLLQAAVEESEQNNAAVHAGIEKPDIRDIAPSSHGYTTWRLIDKPGKNGKKKKTWYIDSLLGYGVESIDNKTELICTPENQVSPDILVIDEAALGFRRNNELWPHCVRDDGASGGSLNVKWVIYKMGYPVLRDSLWTALQKRFGNKLILVIAAEDLRRDEVKVSSGASWERTVQDLAHEIKQNPLLHAARNCRHLVVTFKSEGSFVISDIGKESESGQFIFDPANQEGQWAAENGGEVVGYGACITAGIVKHLMEDHDANLAAGVMRGVAAARELLVQGHGAWDGANSMAQPGFPFAFVAQKLQPGGTGHGLSCVKVNTKNLSTSDSWSLLNEQMGNNTRPLYGIARMVARNGARFIKAMPYGKFGKLLTVDRGEIESLNSIRQLVSNYIHNEKGEKPLSLGVFGPPGAGKSFGIKQVIRGIVPGCTILEYNLSQYELAPQTLIGLLHQVRDEVLKGATPLVFWDEFDSQKLAWLQYLLAPMQDGCFLDGRQIHPIGKCLFVFAGGTASRMDLFTPDIDSPEYREFKLKKGPDFVSRLHGYLNVLGPNKRARGGVDDSEDIFFPIRRALLLRAMAGLSGDQELEIDSGLLSAFLKIETYKHGARSLENVLKPMMMAGASGLFRSNLPPREQIGLHVDYEKFCKIITADSRFHAQAEQLAPVIHDNYRKGEGNEDSEYADTAFENLPPDIQESNLASALRITEILAFAGLKLVDRDSASKPLASKEIDSLLEKNLELLAEAEHNGWMKQKLLNGWQYGEERDDQLRRHPAMVPYEKLDETDKNRDRNNVRSYPAIARQAGFAIVYDEPL